MAYRDPVGGSRASAAAASSRPPAPKGKAETVFRRFLGQALAGEMEFPGKARALEPQAF